jgi:hypothetical protein
MKPEQRSPGWGITILSWPKVIAHGGAPNGDMCYPVSHVEHTHIGTIQSPPFRHLARNRPALKAGRSGNLTTLATSSASL